MSKKISSSKKIDSRDDIKFAEVDRTEGGGSSGASTVEEVESNAESNKKSIVTFLKAVPVLVVILAILVTHNSIWNFAHDGLADGFQVWMAIISFFVESSLLAWFCNTVLFKKKED